jgi:hypothetical protein
MNTIPHNGHTADAFFDSWHGYCEVVKEPPNRRHGSMQQYKPKSLPATAVNCAATAVNCKTASTQCCRDCGRWRGEDGDIILLATPVIPSATIIRDYGTRARSGGRDVSAPQPSYPRSSSDDSAPQASHPRSSSATATQEPTGCRCALCITLSALLRPEVLFVKTHSGK